MSSFSTPDPTAPAPWIEVGTFVLIARVFPETCAWFWTGKHTPERVASDQRRLTQANLQELRNRLASPATRGVFVHVPIRPRRLLHPSLFRMLSGDFGFLAFRDVLSATCPIIGLDFNDEMELSAEALRILERSALFFKRELATDLDRLLPRHASAASRRLLERHASKLRPISLGLSADRIADLPDSAPIKHHDLFFSGNTSLHLRRSEAPLLNVLRERGVRVFQPGSRLPRRDFFAQCAQSWLVWSPEGAGWDCFRHYEAAAASSVPVINLTSIVPYQPFQHQRHALFYRSDHAPSGRQGAPFDQITDGLIETVLHALQDRRRLEQMGRDARDFALQHHTHDQIVRHILQSSGVS